MHHVLGDPHIFFRSFLCCFSLAISQLCSNIDIYFPILHHNLSYLSFLLLFLNSTSSCFEASLKKAHNSNRHYCLALKLHMLEKQLKQKPQTNPTAPKKDILKKQVGFASTEDEPKPQPPPSIHRNCCLFSPLRDLPEYRT